MPSTCWPDSLLGPRIPLYSVSLARFLGVCYVICRKPRPTACVWSGTAPRLPAAMPATLLAGRWSSASLLAQLSSVQILDPWFCSDHRLPSLSLKHSPTSLYRFILFLTFSSPKPNLFPCTHSPSLMRSKYNFSYGIWLPFVVYTPMYDKSFTHRETK